MGRTAVPHYYQTNICVTGINTPSAWRTGDGEISQVRFSPANRFIQSNTATARTPGRVANAGRCWKGRGHTEKGYVQLAVKKQDTRHNEIRRTTRPEVDNR